MKGLLCVYAFVSMMQGLSQAGHYSSDTEYRLVRDLMSKYNKQVKPQNINGHTKPLEVHFSVALAQIIHLDEKNQIITTNCWLNQVWTDLNLQWEPEKFNNISVLRLPYDDVWRPDIVLYNSAHITSESVSTSVIIKHTGEVMWLSMVIFKSSCSIDVKYFPFDTQMCSLDFSSWTYDFHGLNLSTMTNTSEGDLSNYKNSTEWHLINFVQVREVVTFSCCPVPYIFIKNYIHIRRRPLFYVFNMVLPCILITLVALLGFYMPSDSGEKIAMGITTLLSMTVFLMIVADKMPPTSEDLPLVGLYYGITIAIVSFATMMTVFVLNIHHKGTRGREVPSVVKQIFFGVVAKIFFITLELEELPAQPQNKIPGATPKGLQPVPQNDYHPRHDMDKRPENGGISPRCARKFTPTPSTTSGDNTERQFLRVLQKVYQTIEKNEMRLEEQDRREVIKSEWQQLALIIDRLLLFLFVILTTCITMALILPGYYSQSD